jgi:hypothetical protein
MKKIIAAALIGIAAPLAVMAALPTVGCSLDVSSNFVQANQSVTFDYSSQGMSHVDILRDATVIGSSDTTSGSFSTAVPSTGYYTFRFSGVNGSSECKRLVSTPNVTRVR